MLLNILAELFNNACGIFFQWLGISLLVLITFASLEVRDMESHGPLLTG